MEGFLTAGGHRLEYLMHPAHQLDRPTLVFLHEGLGCIALWRDFPERVARATGCRTLVYSRYGFGGSDVLEAPRTPDYMHREALSVLPEVLGQLGIERPVLVGHSDGGSIALIHAARHACTAIAVLAPHLLVEEITVAGIRDTVALFEGSDMAAKLGRYHRDPLGTFRGWSDIWLSPAFRDWNIEECLPAIRCPVLAIQGEDDEYATMLHLDRIAAAVPAPVQLLKLADCRHSPHRDQPEAVLDALTRWLEALD
jgi:pimeloyl-ACP methyl ester carboxylesterase